MRIYITGPVTGIGDLNQPAFTAARRALNDAGYRPLVPHDFVPAGALWQQAMRRSIETLVKADGVACLDGWRESHGARLEVEVAQALGLPVMPLDSWLDNERADRTTAIAKSLKRCPKCERVIPLLMFGRSASSKDGRQGYCLDCMRSRKEAN